MDIIYIYAKQGCDIIITNTIKNIDSDTIHIPIIVRADREGWVPTFDLWQTKIIGDTSYIDCTQSFGKKLRNYEQIQIDPSIGYYNTNGDLIIHWKALINSDDIDLVHATCSGKLRAVCWQKRYCTYFSTGSKNDWIHSLILSNHKNGHVVHHINGVSVDNRKQNLHILPKREHDGIDHVKLDERRKMFFDSQTYWQERKKLAITDFIVEMSLIIMDDARNDFVGKFAEENAALAKEILEVAKYHINLNHTSSKISENRRLNPHLENDYLDTYEIEKYLVKSSPGFKLHSEKENTQLRLF